MVYQGEHYIALCLRCNIGRIWRDNIEDNDYYQQHGRRFLSGFLMTVAIYLQTQFNDWKCLWHIAIGCNDMYTIARIKFHL